MFFLYYTSTPYNFIDFESIFISFGIVFVIIILISSLFIHWFISSAVKKGTLKALKQFYEEYGRLNNNNEIINEVVQNLNTIPNDEQLNNIK